MRLEVSTRAALAMLGATAIAPTGACHPAAFA